MAFRDVGVFEAREVLRLWLAGQGCPSVERLAHVLRQEGRRYGSAAEQLGLVRDSGGGQLSEVFVGMVMDAVCPYRRAGRGEAWQLLSAEHERIAGRAKGDLRGEDPRAAGASRGRAHGGRSKPGSRGADGVTPSTMACRTATSWSALC
jgi:hypothetical protein